MTSFEEALRRTVEGVNQRFTDASGDLHAEVAAASAVVKKLTNNAAGLSLTRLSETSAGAIFCLNFTHSKSDRTAIYAYTVPSDGYPINVFGNPDYIRLNTVELEAGGELRERFGREALPAMVVLHNRSALADHFAGMAKDPASPLVVMLAYLLRRQSQPQPDGTDADETGDIPF